METLKAQLMGAWKGFHRFGHHRFLNSLAGPTHNHGTMQSITINEQRIMQHRNWMVAGLKVKPHPAVGRGSGGGVGDEEALPGRSNPGSSEFDIAADPCIGARGPQLCCGERSTSHHFSPDKLTAGQTRFKAKRAPRRAHAR